MNRETTYTYQQLNREAASVRAMATRDHGYRVGAAKPAPAWELKLVNTGTADIALLVVNYRDSMGNLCSRHVAL